MLFNHKKNKEIRVFMVNGYLLNKPCSNVAAIIGGNGHVKAFLAKN